MVLNHEPKSLHTSEVNRSVKKVKYSLCNYCCLYEDMKRVKFFKALRRDTLLILCEDIRVPVPLLIGFILSDQK